MDLFEFELRYRAYKGLDEKFNLNFSEDDIINLVKITNRGVLETKLTETSIEDLKELTAQTYTQFKKDFIEKNGDIQLENGSLKDYIDRLEYELKVIKEMGYNTYFLIVADYIVWAKKNNIAVGPGRGSAAGSIMSFLIGIIDINPIQYDLLFERFLNPARVSMPDIDTDFEDTQRDRILEYVKEKYGREKIATIGTYMTMAAKAAFKDVARTMGMSFDQANKISANITEKTIPKSLEENEEFKNMVEEDENLKKIVELASKLEGTIRQTGVHACGVIISPEEADNYTPVQYPPKPGGKGEKDTNRIITQYDGHYLEDIGLLKMDFLGLRNLTIIKDTIKIINKRHENEGKELPEVFKDYFKDTVFNPELNDQTTYENIFQNGNTSGIFQFEGDGMRAWLKQLKPNNINDIIAMVALYRPGPMDFIPNYVNRKQGTEDISYMPDGIYEELTEKYGKEVADKEVEKITEDLSPFLYITYGIPIYQEQLMRIVQAMAGFSLGEADILRRGVGKKIREIIDKLKVEFVDRAQKENDYKPETAQQVYEKMIEPAADYSFNKSHASCYAMIAYQTAYLKAHYPLEFHAALLRSVEENTEKLAEHIDELKIQGFKVMPASVNNSYTHVAAIDDTIRLGLLCIKGVGYEASKSIIKERKENGKFESLEDFLTRCKKAANKKSLESLAKSGALDELEDRQTIIHNVSTILDRIKGTEESSQGGGLFDTSHIKPSLEFKEKYNTTLLEKLLMEYETFETFIYGHPFDGLYSYIKGKYNFISMFKDVENYGEFNILSFVKDIRRIPKKGFILVLEDLSGEIEIFMKDVGDIQKFDILNVKGYKGKSVRLKEAIKIDFDSLVETAKKNKKYKPEETTMEIRHKRLSSANKKQQTQENNQTEETTQKEYKQTEESLNEEKNENIEKTQEIQETQEIENKDTNNQSYSEDYEQQTPQIEIPDDIEKLKKISEILKSYPGEKKVYIGDKLYNLSDKGISSLYNLK